MSIYDFLNKFFNHNLRGSFERPPASNEGYNPPGNSEIGGDIARVSPPGFNFNFNAMIRDSLNMLQMFEHTFQDFPLGEDFFKVEDSAIEPPQNPRDSCLKPRPPEHGSDVDSPAKDFPSRSNFAFDGIMDSMKMFKSMAETLEDTLKGFPQGEEFFNFGGSAIESPPQNHRDACLKPRPPEHGSDVDSSAESSEGPRRFISSSIVIRKSVRLPDGSMKTEEIRRNPDGSEERTESHSPPGENRFDNFNVDIFPDFQKPQIPDERKNLPRSQYLKPGFEKMNPYEGKIDKVLDDQVLESLFSSPEEPGIVESNPAAVRPSFNITKEVIVLRNGVVRTVEVIRNPDGTEQRTVSNTVPGQANIVQDRISTLESQDVGKVLSSVTALLDTLLK